MDFVRKLLGLPSQPYASSSFEFTGEDRPLNMPRADENGHRNFNVFTDPLEMHRYFEQQMDTFFKSFGLPNFGQFSRAVEEPDVDDVYQVEEYASDSRHSFLKRGSSEPKYEHASDKADKDLDGKLAIADLDTLLNNSKESETGLIPNNKNDLKVFRRPTEYYKSFRKTVEVRSVRQPDGSYETRRIVTDVDGNKETTITKKMGDKEYTVITRQDRDGKEEVRDSIISSAEEKSLFSTILFKPLLNDSLLKQFFK